MVWRPDVVREAARVTGIGVLWRAALFVIACFALQGLIELRDWHDAYVLTDAWSVRVRAEPDEWAADVAAAGDRLRARKTFRHPNEERLQIALLSEIRNPTEKTTTPPGRTVNLNHVRAEIVRIRGDAAARAASLDKRIREQVDKVLELDGQLLAAATDKDEEALSKKRQQRVATINALTVERNAVDWYEKRIKPLQTEVDEAAVDIKKVVETTSRYARSTDVWLHPFFTPDQLLRIGDSTDSMHLIFIVVWYGLEAAVIAIVCMIVVPWIIRWTSKADVKDARSVVTTKLQEWFGKVLGNSTRKVANVAVAAAVATATLVSLNAAAGPPVHDDQPVLTAPGAVEEDARKQKRKDEEKKNGEALDPEDEKNDGQKTEVADTDEEKKDLVKELEDLKASLEAQRALLAALETDVKLKAGELEALSNHTSTLARNVTSVSNNTESLFFTTSMLRTSVSLLADVDRALMARSAASDSAILTRLGRVQAEQATVTALTTDLRQQVSGARDEINEVEGAVLDANVTWDDAGYFGRLNPFRKYEVTSFAVRTMRHHAKQRHNSDAATAAVDAMARLQGGRHMSGRAFRRMLLELADLEARDRKLNPAEVKLEMKELLPLIVNLSRVPR